MFHFKKFSINDEGVAMKVGTDSVLLGAWTKYHNPLRILDVGTGSGILALMMAQRYSNIAIDAVEIEAQAVKTAKVNFENSAWSQRLHAIHSDIQHFSETSVNRYSLIISNPPFFSQSLKTPHAARNLARHNDTLSIHDFLKCASHLLLPNGIVSVIFPFDTLPIWIAEAKRFSLFPCEVMYLKSSPTHFPHRAMVAFTNKSVVEMIENELIIYALHRTYSDDYKELTRDFYLKF